MLTRADLTVDSPMILFEHIVEILHRSMPAILHQRVLGFEFYDGWRVIGLLVGVEPEGADGSHLPRLWLWKRLAAAVSRLAERRKSMVAPVESTARYRYTHLPLTRM